jgi:hypothetical protein
LAEAINEQNQQNVQLSDEVEVNSVSDIIGSGRPYSSQFIQIINPINEERAGVDRNSPMDIIGSGPEFNNELILLKNPINEERNGVENNSAMDLIGSGPEWNPDSFV